MIIDATIFKGHYRHEKECLCDGKRKPKFSLQLFHDLHDINFAKMPQQDSVKEQAEDIDNHQKTDFEKVCFDVGDRPLELPYGQLDVSHELGIGSKAIYVSV